MIEQLIANFHGGGRLVFWMLIPFALLGIGLALWRIRRQHNPLRPSVAIWRSFLDAGIGWTVVAMLVVAFYGYGSGFHQAQLVPFSEFFHLDDGNDTYAGLGLLLGNVLLFIPIAVLVTWRAPRWRVGQIVLGALVVSIVIEVLQFATGGGRTASIDDVILNTLGAAIGTLAARGIRTIYRRWRVHPTEA